MNQSNISYAYLQALPLGVIRLQDVTLWADSMILKEDDPCFELLELSLCKEESMALIHLKTLSLGYDEEQAIKVFFELCYDSLVLGTADYLTVAERLFIWSAYETSLEGYSGLCSFWDDLKLAYDGIHGNPVKVEKQLLEYLCEMKA